ncbi:MAG TPA: ATP-binding protein [Mycobacteriales bacterium]|nr:ATP-binding protein [Mycobacteriales bacterium]
MSLRRRRRRALPLWMWAAGIALALGVIVTGGCATGIALAGRLTVGTAALSLGLGALGTAIAVVAAALAADNAAEALRSLRDEAVRRIREPDLIIDQTETRGVRSTAEMSELGAAVEALALRMRVADEFATRHKQGAEAVSAGMFELLSGLIAAEEAARGQLAAELHDTVAQSLAAARTLLADGQYPRAGDMLEEAEEQTRAVMARTRPPALRDGDLALAVGELRDEMAQRYGLRVELHWPAQPRALPLAAAVTVYRFFQESLLNVVKHADVDTARVALGFEVDSLVATVRDTGAGFDPAQVRPERGRHVGLGLLRERVRLAGGSVEVVSKPGAGATLTMTLPLALRASEGVLDPVETQPSLFNRLHSGRSKVRYAPAGLPQPDLADELAGEVR